MSKAKIRASFPEEATEVMKPKKLSQIKDKDERRFRIEDAVRTFERFAEVKRDIELIKTDQELFEAVKVVLDQKVADLKAAKKT